MNWSFSYSSFVKVSLFNTVHSFGPKIFIKKLHCIGIHYTCASSQDFGTYHI